MTSQEWNHISRIAKWGLIGIIGLIGISIAVSIIFFSARPASNYYYPFFFPFHFWFGGIFLIFLVFFAARWLFWPWRQNHYWHQDGNAVSILKERYAKGDITKEQFDQMMQDLKPR